MHPVFFRYKQCRNKDFSDYVEIEDCYCQI